MTKFVLFVFFIGYIFIPIAVGSVQETVHTIANLDDNHIGNQKKESALDIYLKTFSDSIDAIIDKKVLPKFLDNPQFDYTYEGLWAPSHHPLPLRKLILDKVRNCKSLQVILDSKNPKFRLKPVIEHNISVKYLEFSFHELVKNRRRKLACK